MPIARRSFDSLNAPLAAATMILMSLASVDAVAQACLHWSDLDKQLYCDESRDLVADTPSQGFKLQDPDTLVFSHAPVEGPSAYREAFGEFMRYLSKTTGKKVRWHGTKSSVDQIMAMRAGEVHVSGISPGPTVYAVNLAGYVPIAVMCKSDGTFGYELNLITRKDSNIASPDDLEGRKVAQVSPLSNSGQVAKDDEIVYSGSQGNSIKAVVDGEYPAAAVNSNTLARMENRGAVDSKELRVVWESGSFPSTSFGFAHNLAPDLQRKVHDAFLTFDWKGTGLARVFGRQAEKFCTISYEETWGSIRLIQKENGIRYNAKDL